MESPNFQAQFQCIMKQTTRNQVPITTQKEFYFVLPPLTEQRKIAEILSASEAKIANRKSIKNEIRTN
jgi:type I restriction enzyme S subunit